MVKRKIKEIAEDCGFWIAYENQEVSEFEIDFFATQIIKDCLSVVDWDNASHIKEYFGTEE